MTAKEALSKLERPTRIGNSTSATFGGIKVEIAKVKAGYNKGVNSNMYHISVYDKGERVFNTNRYGSSAWKDIKDDTARYFNAEEKEMSGSSLTRGTGNTSTGKTKKNN